MCGPREIRVVDVVVHWICLFQQWVLQSRVRQASVNQLSLGFLKDLTQKGMQFAAYAHPKAFLDLDLLWLPQMHYGYAQALARLATTSRVVPCPLL